MKRILRKLCMGAIGFGAVWVFAAMVLTFWPGPRLSKALERPGPSASVGACHDGGGMRCFRMRDGAVLAAREEASSSGVVVLFLHGVLGSSAEFAEAARALRESTGAAVVRLDLRGHGLSAGSPGDLDHIGQYEEDVADVVSALRRESPGSRIVLAGHSMGGGIVTRYGLRRDVPPVDGYLLLAPLLGQSSPTSRREPGRSAGPEAEILKVRVARIIGLAMLNSLGIRGLNGLDTLYFDLPGSLPVRTYTFRAMASMAPNDYRAALTADSRPMLVLVGENDEAFRARAYPAVVALHRNGRTVLVSGQTHDGVTKSPAALEAARDWIAELGKS